MNARNPAQSMTLQEVAPFLVSATLWLAVGILVCAQAAEPQNIGYSIIWFVALWALGIVDLYALTRAIVATSAVMSAAAENRGPTAVQALYWGILKLACIGIFGAILISVSGIPTSGLLLGLGTLVFVPVVGGFWWSQRALRHA